MSREIQLLDCTLRDGGYVNDWNFGYRSIKEIIKMLVKARVDIVEVGFLRLPKDYEPSQDISRWPSMEQLVKVLPRKKENTIYSAMCIHDCYDVNLLPECDGSGVDMIRATFHNYDVDEGLEFCKQVIKKGYKVSVNPINIMGYSDEEILELIKKVNEIQPYAFSVVDTFGSMKHSDLERLVLLIDNNMNPDIRMGLHLHENLAQSFSLSQSFLNMRMKRGVIIDGSLMGMGRIPGNLSLELEANYLNENFEKNYDIDYMLDAIEEYILPIKGDSPWGYTTAYFLSAKYNLHRNYAEYFINKGNLTHRDINRILSRITADKKAAFDSDYANGLYEEYLNNIVDDNRAIEELTNLLCDKDILVLAPGESVTKYRELIDNYIKNHVPIIISCNFIHDDFHIDYAFFSNNKRYEKYSDKEVTSIVTSNINSNSSYVLNYNSLAESSVQNGNALIMLMKLMEKIGVKKIAIAGADGYMLGENHYFDKSIRSFFKHDHTFNFNVKKELKQINVEMNFITPSAYEE